MIRVFFLALFAFTHIAGAQSRKELDLGPVLPEHAPLVAKIEALSCVQSVSIRARPFSECENYRRMLRGVFATIKRDSEAFDKASTELAESVGKQVDINSGAQCAVGKVLDRSYAHISALDSKNKRNIEFARRLHEGLGPKPWIELKRFREAWLMARNFSACISQPPEKRKICEPPLSGGTYLNSMRSIGRILKEDTKDLGEGSRAFKLVTAAESELKDLSNIALKVKAQLDTAQRASEASKAKLQHRRAEIRQKFTCVRSGQDAANKVKAATVFVGNKDAYTRGSGFYVRTLGPDGREHFTLVTARHVAANEKGKVYSLSPVVLMPSEDAERAANIELDNLKQDQTFKIEPGRYDLGNDLVSLEAPARANALQVVENDKAPEPSQEFRINGHPGYAGSEFTSHKCTFSGYGPSVEGAGTDYYMSCPSAVTFQNGMSGGPVTDANGVAWGVVSSHGGSKETIRVAPIFSKPDGSVQLGLQKIFLTDFCVRPGQSGHYRCQVIPGYGWSTDGL